MATRRSSVCPQIVVNEVHGASRNGEEEYSLAQLEDRNDQEAAIVRGHVARFSA